MNKLVVAGTVALLAACGGQQVSENTQKTARPEAKILLDGSASTGTAPLMEYLDATYSVCREGCMKYEWDFGDGSPVSNEAWTTHVYDAAGSYLVRLTVTDAAGATSTAVVKIIADE
jgi:chitodextrinase